MKTGIKTREVISVKMILTRDKVITAIPIITRKIPGKGIRDMEELAVRVTVPALVVPAMDKTLKEIIIMAQDVRTMTNPQEIMEPVMEAELMEGGKKTGDAAM